MSSSVRASTSGPASHTECVQGGPSRHPSPEAREGRRARTAGERGTCLHAPVDFETESLRHGLDASGFDWTKPTMFSWLGVTHYLTVDAIDTTLRTISDAAPGSEVVFDYRPDESILDENGKTFWETFGPVAVQSGEPLQDQWAAVGIRRSLRVAACKSQTTRRARRLFRDTSPTGPMVLCPGPFQAWWQRECPNKSAGGSVAPALFAGLGRGDPTFTGAPISPRRFVPQWRSN